jgi:hypothetical protein
MEKQLSATGYWLGLICTVLALIFRLLTALNKIPPLLGVRQCHLLPEFPSRCCVVFPADDCKLVPSPNGL